MTAPVQIRREDVVEDIRRLSQATGKPITEAVGSAVKSALAEIDEARAGRMARIMDIVAEFKALPIVGPILTDEDLYDDDGLPK